MVDSKACVAAERENVAQNEKPLLSGADRVARRRMLRTRDGILLFFLAFYFGGAKVPMWPAAV